MSTWGLTLFRSNALESNFVGGYYGYGDGYRCTFDLKYGFGDGDGDGFGDGDGDGDGDGPGQSEGWCVPQKEAA